ncbi:substrate-binding domain-containing protein [Dactylosporangium aurantiacum]|uniref:Substrate-binding domain-containing protein n=1 Tax=Dactylosporangium aurantiacum TaxID=35754 RepID=A0A9Q9IM86_9ACTN|nr:substrate-binding domain-containing protein [Dactylosporangium aurantiacum]MDG6107664.1 substrate-binding domain-containing protein [Dactylosporangium aurantiacum]UWZ58742.1 substrate-binding domain-containing protein [Dactylosporangium aurantiacum]
MDRPTRRKGPLRAHQSHRRVIGVVTADATMHGPAATLHGVESAARAAGYALAYQELQHADRSSVAAALAALVSESVAGIVVTASQAKAGFGDLPAAVPCVKVGPAESGGLPSVWIDQVVGARLATQHLLGLGHRTVWHVAGPESAPETHSRIDGWRTALDQAGAPVPAPIPGHWGAEAGYRAGVELARRDGVTAVFAANDQMAIGVLRAFHEHGISVPGDVSVSGFDDIPEAAYLNPPLTTIRQDFDEVGRACVAMLLRHLRRPAVPDRDAFMMVKPALIVRRSTRSARST